MTGQARKTFATWLILIALFAVIYFSFSPGKTSHAGPSGTFSLELFGVLFAVLLVIFAVMLRRNLRELRRFQTENTNALAENARGNYESARATFSRWLETTRVPRIVAVARHNLAWTLARMGRLEEAIEVAQANDGTSQAQLETAAMAPTSALDLALYQALAGHLVEAKLWLERADARDDKMTLPHASAMRGMAVAVLDCRAGRAAQAATNLDEHWAEYEAVLTGDIVRMLRLVRSFAKHEEGPRHAGPATIDLASLRPAYPGEYAMLTAGWPEMAAFLAVNGLA